MNPTIDVLSPADGQVIGQVPEADAAAVERVVSALRIHQPAWEQIGPAGRADWVRKFRDWLLDEADHLADVLQSETAKPRAEATMEIPIVAEMTNLFVKNAAKFLADERVKPAGLLNVQRMHTKVYRPYPVVGVISPWNFPYIIPGMDSITALLAGAAVLLKPSEVTPLSALELQRGWREIGAPPVFEVVTGRGETGAALVDKVDFVQFTGSTRTGRLIAHRCVDRMIPYSLELGGKDPAIVLADADLDRTVRGVAWGALVNSGQVCVSIERVYVEAPIYDDFVARLTEHVSALRQGRDDRTYRFDVGAMATTAQRELVATQVDQAITAGAKALTGGQDATSGNFIAPTVLVDVDQSMTCMREETFGPMIPVVKVADTQEAIRLANDSVYGLSASVWTGDRARGEWIARQLDVGAVNINGASSNMFNANLPHGGWKSSGVGTRLGGANGLRKYTRQQAITSPRLAKPDIEPDKLILWYPYNRSKGRLASRVLHAVAGRDLRRRMRLRRQAKR